MPKLMMSWMAQKYRSMELKAFRAEFTDHCLVWEPGEWRPPSKSGRTVVTTSDQHETAKGKSGDTLAIVLPSAAPRPELILGRDPQADLVVDDATVSSRHLTLIRRGETWFTKSSGSTNGSWINEKPLAEGVEMPLVPSDRLRVGMVTLTYYDPKGLYFRIKAG